MPKRELADRILDEILTLRKPRAVLVELDEREGRFPQSNQDRVLEETIPAVAARRQMIVE
jgi:hypothetical protein